MVAHLEQYSSNEIYDSLIEINDFYVQQNDFCVCNILFLHKRNDNFVSYE